MVLRDNPAATEVMAYVTWMFVLIGCWLAVQRSASKQTAMPLNASGIVALPAVVALLGCLVFTGSEGEGLSWASVPDAVFAAVLFAPMLAVSLALQYGSDARLHRRKPGLQRVKRRKLMPLDLRGPRAGSVGRCVHVGGVRTDP